MSKFETLVEDLIRSGLISVNEMEAVTSALENSGEGGNEQALVNRLQEVGQLTGYQVVSLLAGRANELTFGNYIVLNKIGEGGMGAVYRARHRRMKRIVAIKLLPRERLSSSESQQRFQHEIETVSQLSHPNIVTAYDADECPLGPFLVMEYVAGCDLAQILEADGPLSLHLAVDYVTQTARALEYAHSQNIVHRDIKPANLLRDNHGTIKVTDLGLAQLIIADEVGLSANVGESRRNTISGTIDYMSPEQLDASDELDNRADIYSLGCTLFYLLTGKVPVLGETILQKMQAHRRQQRRPLTELRSDIPAELDRIYQQMTATNPLQRFPSMTAVIEALEACVLPPAMNGEDSPDQNSRPGAPRPQVDRSAPTSWSESGSISLVDVSLLLVEPSKLQSRVITGQLAELGVSRIQTATTGAAALATMLNSQPDLVLSALHLPDMTGADLVESMREHPRLKDQAFVLISGATEFDLLEAVRQSGTAAILSKPFGLDDLRRTLAVAIDFLSPDAVRAHNLQVAGTRVLIADDSRSARRHVRRVLENLGIDKFVEAGDGRAALESLAASPCDLIVTDYHMPHLDGPDLVRRLRLDPRYKQLPVLMITSETDPAHLATAREAGVSAICSKVFDPQTVCRLLATILDKRGLANQVAG